MKICRFLPHQSDHSAQKSESAAPKFGLIEGDEVYELTAAPWSALSRGTATYPSANVKLVAPVTPTKIVCVDQNYPAPPAERGNEKPKEPMIFLKPPSSIGGPGEPNVRPNVSQ